PHLQRGDARSGDLGHLRVLEFLTVFEEERLAERWVQRIEKLVEEVASLHGTLRRVNLPSRAKDVFGCRVEPGGVETPSSRRRPALIHEDPEKPGPESIRVPVGPERSTRAEK